MHAIIKHRKCCLAQYPFKRSGEITLKQIDSNFSGPHILGRS